MRLLIFILIFPFLLCAESTMLLIPPFKHSWGIHKGTEKELQLFLGPNARFENPEGLAVVRLKSWDDPSTEADDDEVTVYGVNSGQGEVIFNSSMYSLNLYRGDGERAFANPHGITGNSDGLVYVADTDNHRVVKLHNDGKQLKFVGTVGETILSSPWGVALDSQGNLCVSDYDQGKVVIFAPDGKYKEDFPATFDHPTAIAVVDQNETWSYFAENLLAVIDSSGKRLSLFNFLGELIGKTNYKKIGLKEASFQYLAFDYYNNLYVTDKVNCKVHKFTRKLVYLGGFGSCGTGENQFEEPRGIAIYRKYGQVFIAERASAQYYWIGVDITDFSAKMDEDSLRIDFNLTETAFVTLKLKSKGNSLTIKDREKIKPGKVIMNIPKRFIKPGNYEILLEAEPTYSSRGNFKKELKGRIKID